MAQAAFTLFADARQYVSAEDFLANTMKIAFVTATAALTEGTEGPCWGSGGDTDLSANEAAGGNVPSGGFTLAGKSASGDPLLIGASSLSQIAQNASNPDNVRYAVIYDDDDANKRAWAFADYGSDQDLSAGPNDVTFENGILSIDSTVAS